jgi:WD40 repeat protein
MERSGSPFYPRTKQYSDEVRRVFPSDLSPEPDTFVTVSDGGLFRMHDRETWGELHVWDRHEGSVVGASFWNGMAAVISNNPQKLSLLNLTGDKSVKSVKISAPGISSGLEAVGLMHRAPQAVIATTDHIGLVDVETGRGIRVIKNDYASTSSLQAVPNCTGLAIQQEGTGKIKITSEIG